MKPVPLSLLSLLLPTLWAGFAAADTTNARCDIYPKGSDQVDTMVACTFSQRQGAVGIARADGIRYDLTPVGDAPGTYRDAQGRPAYRQKGLGNQGQIYRLADVSVYVYWDTSALNPADRDNWTAPFSTKDYDATTRLRCKAAGASAFGDCPAGILRMEDARASIVIQSPLGRQFTVNFLRDDVNATVGQVEARLDGDTWTLTRDNGEVYQVPLAAIEGG
jgi:hypothetical protein